MKTAHLAFAALMGSQATADQGLTVVPRENVNLNDVNFTGQACHSGGFAVNLLVSCFGVNLRHVKDPLSPDHDVTAKIDFMRHDGVSGSITFTIPSEAITKGGLATFENLVVDQTPANFAPGIAGAVEGQTVLANFNAKGKTGQRLYDFRGITFSQVIKKSKKATVTAEYVATEGAVSSSLKFNYSADNSLLYVETAFPGAKDTCGSYYSPLMVFLTDERPAIRRKVGFKLRPESDAYFWPDGSKDWAFLALDRNGNGRIDDGGELFGAGEKNLNGFDALKPFDSNGDGVIDPQDKIFPQLRLWFDLNGDGRTQKGELVSPGERQLERISLKYSRHAVEPQGKFAELRERAPASVNGRKVEVVDVWLGPTRLEPERKVENKKEKP